MPVGLPTLDDDTFGLGHKHVKQNLLLGWTLGAYLRSNDEFSTFFITDTARLLT